MTERTLLGHVGFGSSGVASRCGSHARVWSRTNRSVEGLGSLNGFLDGFIVSGDCASMMEGAPAVTRLGMAENLSAAPGWQDKKSRRVRLDFSWAAVPVS